MNKNILYISYDGMTDPLGQSQVIPYLQGLSEAGYTIHLISCEKSERYIANKELISKILKNASITWHPLNYHKSPPILSTIFDLFKIYQLANKLNQTNSFKLTHCRSYLSSIIGLHLKVNKGIPFIFDMRGLWADERVDGKIWNIKNPLYKFIYNYFKGKEKRFIKESDYIISLTEAGKSEIESWDVHKITKTPIFVIPCSCDFELYRKTEEEEMHAAKKELGLEQNSFVLSYIGSLGTWYMLEEMLDFFKLLSIEKPNAIFLILTPDNPEHAYKTAELKKIDRNKIRVLFSTKNKLAYYASISDYSIFFIMPKYSKIASSPTKLGELLSMKIPVITNTGIGDVSEIINTTNGGVMIQNFNRQEYCNAIEKIKKLDPDMEMARNKALSIFNLKNAIKKYIEVYDIISNA